ncbi:hypothetical protein [Marispirochaeta aestuarii]|uniref:hypothetical protein n=1 Tax=Marispirochaeta aestuarii TaxID=1963862 RepID=UPI002ABE8904|nr:hypothetical protein [Marispirochaeta aestuarii]
MNFIEEHQLLITNGIFTLLGVLLGGFIPIIKDLINRKAQYKIERIKLHDQDKIEAYKTLYLLVRDLRLINHEKQDKSGQKKDLDFLGTYAKRILECNPNYPYFTKEIRNDLLKLNAVLEKVMFYVMEEDKNIKTIESELPSILLSLDKNILKEFTVWE